MSEQQKKPLPGFVLIFIYLSPLYVLAAWPVIKWMKMANSSDVAINSTQEAAFKTDREMPRPERRVPIVREVGSAPIQEDPDDKGQGRILISREEPEQTAESTGTVKNKKNAGRKDRHPNRNRFMADITAVLEKNEAAAFAALLNSPETVKRVLNLPGIKPTLVKPKSLAGNIKTSDTLDTLLANPHIPAALEKPAVVAAVVRSELVKQMAASPTGRALAKKRELFEDMVDAHPMLKKIFSDPSVIAALSINEPTADLGQMAKAVAYTKRTPRKMLPPPTPGAKPAPPRKTKKAVKTPAQSNRIMGAASSSDYEEE